jgi:hypothetical protein
MSMQRCGTTGKSATLTASDTKSFSSAYVGRTSLSPIFRPHVTQSRSVTNGSLQKIEDMYSNLPQWLLRALE